MPKTRIKRPRRPGGTLPWRPRPKAKPIRRKTRAKTIRRGR